MTNKKKKSKEELYRELLGERRAWYKQQKPLYCPALKTNIYFTGEGFHHLSYNSHRRARPVADRIGRLRYLKRALAVIQIAEEIVREEEKRLPDGRIVKRWGLIAALGPEQVKLKVVIEQKGNGNYTFFGVYRIGK